MEGMSARRLQLPAVNFCVEVTHGGHDLYRWGYKRVLGADPGSAHMHSHAALSREPCEQKKYADEVTKRVRVSPCDLRISYRSAHNLV
jgi:hypothetical protein